MRRRGYMFTGRSHDEKGIMSAIFGVISIVSMILVIYLSYRLKGAMSPKLGAATFFALIISGAGETVGIISRLEKDRFYLFPNIGIVLNSIAIFIIICLLYMGLFDI